MRPIISISFPEPYITLEEYSRRTGIPVPTVRDMVRDGRIPIMPKPVKDGRVIEKARVLINLAALTVSALTGWNIELPNQKA